MASDTTTNGLRRGKVLEMFTAKRDSLRRAYPLISSPAPATATAAPAQPLNIAQPPAPAVDEVGMRRRFHPSMMKR